jgi:predicted RND superfamily exporter protein
MKIRKTFYILIVSLILLPNNLSLAEGYDFDSSSGLDTSATSGGFAGTLFNNSDSINTAISQVIGIVLSFLGVIFLVLTIVAGYQWMTAGGNQEQVQQAQQKLKNSVIGLIIVLAAYAITVLVTTILTNQTFTN